MFCYDENRQCFRAFEHMYGEDYFGEQPRISLVGAGGKTTTLFRLRDYFRRCGRPVAMTTTTKMFREDKPWFLICPSRSDVEKILRLYGQVYFAGEDAVSKKVCAPPSDMIKYIYSDGIPVIAEADGAKGMCVKAPAAHEPVLLEDTTHLISLYGMSAVGRKISEAGFRVEQITAVLNKKADELLTEADIVALALSAEGGRKGQKDAKYIIVLNQADTRRRLEQSLVVKKMIEEKGSFDVLITGRGILCEY